MAGIRFDFVMMGIGELLKKTRLEVPPNQRSYAWEEKNVETLLQDLSEAISSGAEDYFLGTVVLVKTDKGHLIIEDGQQRIATMSIFLARVRDKLIELNRKRSSDSVDNDFLKNVDRDTEATVPRLKMNLEDNDFYIRRILPSPIDLEYANIDSVKAVRTSNERLLLASDYAADFINKLLETAPPTSHPETLLRWVSFAETKAMVAVVTVADEASAYRMFETLNDRGLRASQADILKNHFFSRAKDRQTEASATWNIITGAIETLGDDDSERLITFLRHLWITTHGPTKERELAAAIKLDVGSESRTMEFLSDASAAVHDYIALWSSRHPKWTPYKASVRQSVDTLATHLQVEQIRPLLFAVARHFDQVEAEKAFRLFVSWSVRFLIFGGRGGMLDLQYSRRAQEVGTKKIRKARELRDAMADYVPTDSEFEQAFSTARVSRQHLARYYLRALDKTLKSDEQPEYVANEEVSDVNLEHVLPWSPNENWNVDSDLAKAAQRMLGNMVLLRATQNRDLAGKSFDEKKAVYQESGYFVTNPVAEYSEWNIDTIRDRQAKLAKIAVKTWPLTFGD